MHVAIQDAAGRLFRSGPSQRATAIVLCALVALLLALPAGVLAATFVVTSIPGSGWIQGPDNNAADAVIVEGPGPSGSGLGSVALESGGIGDFVGVGRALLQPLTDLTGASWWTYVAGDTTVIEAEPASLRIGMYRLGGLSEFTTLVVERYLTASVTAGVWQETTLGPSTLVWQTTDDGGFCISTSPCMFSAFVAQYPDAAMIGLQVAIGTQAEATTSFVDLVSLTVDGVTDTWDFEPAVEDASSAVISDPVPTSTGGTVTVDLVASALSVEPVTFAIVVDGVVVEEVTLAPGETGTVVLDLPFGTTTVEVLTHEVVLDSVEITLTAAATPVPASAAPVASTAPLPDTAVTRPTSSGPVVLFAFGLFAAVVAIARRRSRPTR